MSAKFIAQQLSHPAGAIGRWILGPLWNRRNRPLNDVSLAQLDLHSVDRVLEVGFGGGYLLGRMSVLVTDGFIGGVDVSATMVEQCRARYRSLVQTGKLDLKVGTAEQLPYPDRHFTKAVSVNSIFYWPAAPSAIAEIARALDVHGHLVLCFTDKDSLQQKDFARHGLTLYNAADVQHLLEDNGFHEINLTQHADRHRSFWCVTALRSST
ncbi:demethylmenaquinone methyltransferase / 2-methoxy-6-polyprenyl-1,4-benzoquinol methylase [Thermoflexales bacterium]|nr:demethylmenaquinone methyltransferase / 2-methoxy-6-polyprenyl-1,4-benzoquinol methylase [Thermoflexales bacterium]